MIYRILNMIAFFINNFRGFRFRLEENINNPEKRFEFEKVFTVYHSHNRYRLRVVRYPNRTYEKDSVDIFFLGIKKTKIPSDIDPPFLWIQTHNISGDMTFEEIYKYFGIKL